MSRTNEEHLDEEYRCGSNSSFNETLLAFLNAASKYDLIAIWQVISHLERYYESELGQTLKFSEDIVTNAFRTIREAGLVEGYLRPSLHHPPSGSSLAIVLEHITPQGLVCADSEAFTYFKTVVDDNPEELAKTPLKKTASNCELLKALLRELIEEDISESLCSKAQKLLDELNAPVVTENS